MAKLVRIKGQSERQEKSGELDYYRELVSRNRHFVNPATQSRLRELKFLVAGCGSTGGACIESLARLGIKNFVLADNGSYELTNLNRQHAFTENIGQNKAEFHAGQLLKINPHILVKTYAEGLSLENLPDVVRWSDLIMDAVDVTTQSGMKMKLALHEEAKARSKPVLTAFDLGFCQYGRSYDYRNSYLPALDGKIAQAKKAKHPIKALFTVLPLSTVPAHCLPLIYDLLVVPDTPASQLGSTSDMLSAIIGPTVLRFAETGELVSGWKFDMESLAKPWSERLKARAQGVWVRAQILWLLKKIE